jgi:hypothetical protein
MPLEENDMGTCPKCKLRIRKNGNHVKLGSVWFHKMCPPKPGASAKRA